MNKVYRRHLKLNYSAVDIFKRLGSQKNLFFLDSSLSGAHARFSYLGFDPVEIIQGKDLAQLKQAWGKRRLPLSEGHFPAGAVGYLGYDGRIWF